LGHSQGEIIQDYVNEYQISMVERPDLAKKLAVNLILFKRRRFGSLAIPIREQ
jgi:hypothetical protein